MVPCDTGVGEGGAGSHTFPWDPQDSPSAQHHEGAPPLSLEQHTGVVLGQQSVYADHDGFPQHVVPAAQHSDPCRVMQHDVPGSQHTGTEEYSQSHAASQQNCDVETLQSTACLFTEQVPRSSQHVNCLKSKMEVEQQPSVVAL